MPSPKCYHDKRTADNREYINARKTECLVCGYSRCKEALEFHHLDPSVKTGRLSKMLAWSRKRIQEEIDKCVVLCCLCHREHHHLGIKLEPISTKGKK